LCDLDSLFTQLIVRRAEISFDQLTRALFLFKRGPKFCDFLLRCVSLALRTAHSLITPPYLFATDSRSTSNGSYLFSMRTRRCRLARDQINLCYGLVQTPRLLSFL